jgi:transcriptional regulator with XRE-family HTH domain
MLTVFNDHVRMVVQRLPMPPQELGRAVRKARESKGLSLRGLQELSGVEYSYIAYLEQGKIQRPDPRKLHQLASALDVEIEDFYALAGYLPAHGLPGLQPYLRAKYDLPESAAAQVDAYVHRLRAQYEKQQEQQGKDRDGHKHPDAAS